MSLDMIYSLFEPEFQYYIVPLRFRSSFLYLYILFPPFLSFFLRFSSFSLFCCLFSSLRLLRSSWLWSIIYLFICGSFNDTVSSSDYDRGTGALSNRGTLQLRYWPLRLCELARSTASSETTVTVLPTARAVKFCPCCVHCFLTVFWVQRMVSKFLLFFSMSNSLSLFRIVSVPLLLLAEKCVQCSFN
jgi:hypothetical protein